MKQVPADFEVLKVYYLLGYCSDYRDLEELYIDADLKIDEAISFFVEQERALLKEVGLYSLCKNEQWISTHKELRNTFIMFFDMLKIESELSFQDLKTMIQAKVVLQIFYK